MHTCADVPIDRDVHRSGRDRLHLRCRWSALRRDRRRSIANAELDREVPARVSCIGLTVYPMEPNCNWWCATARATWVLLLTMLSCQGSDAGRCSSGVVIFILRPRPTAGANLPRIRCNGGVAKCSISQFQDDRMSSFFWAPCRPTETTVSARQLYSAVQLCQWRSCPPRRYGHSCDCGCMTLVLVEWRCCHHNEA